MEGVIGYYHKGSKKPTDHYCEILNDELIVYESIEKKKQKKKINLKQCIKISTYIDDEQSWELSDNENSYRFTAKNRNENYKWKSYIENALMPKFDKTDGKNEYIITFDIEKSTRELVDSFKAVLDAYTLKIEDYGLSLQSCVNLSDKRQIDYKCLRQYGNVKHGEFLLELGSKNPFGAGQLYFSFDDDKTNEIVCKKIETKALSHKKNDTEAISSNHLDTHLNRSTLSCVNQRKTSTDVTKEYDDTKDFKSQVTQILTSHMPPPPPLPPKPKPNRTVSSENHDLLQTFDQNNSTYNNQPVYYETESSTPMTPSNSRQKFEQNSPIVHTNQKNDSYNEFSPINVVFRNQNLNKDTPKIDSDYANPIVNTANTHKPHPIPQGQPKSLISPKTSSHAKVLNNENDQTTSQYQQFLATSHIYDHLLNTPDKIMESKHNNKENYLNNNYETFTYID